MLLFEDGMVTNENPQFDARTYYQLASASPCVDTAIGVGLTNDLLGVRRPLLDQSGRRPVRIRYGRIGVEYGKGNDVQAAVSGDQVAR